MYNENDARNRFVKFGICDICGHETTVVQCPSSSEEVKANVLYFHWFCEDCCKEIFESQGCQSDVGNCDRATELMRCHLEEYAKERGFKRSEKHQDVYLSKSGVYCLGTYTITPEEFFEDEETAEIHCHEGEEHILVKFSGDLYSFGKSIINEILEAFKDLNCYGGSYRLLKNNGFLVVLADGAWSVLAPHIDPNTDYTKEKNLFIKKIRQGRDFFEITKDDGVLLLEYKAMKFDWSKLDAHKFVELCSDILKSLPEMEEVKITEGTHDLGQDISAKEIVRCLVGTEKRKWTVQCKHFISRKIAESDITDLANSHAQLKFEVFCLMTSNFVLPGCHRLLESWDKMERYNFKTTVWNRNKLETHLRNKPEIYAKYFA